MHSSSFGSCYDDSAMPSFSFLLFPLGAGSILGVYVTVLVTTSRMCLTLVPHFFSHRWAGGPALVGGSTALLLDTSAYRLAFNAASQSKGLLTLRALNGERTGLSTAGLGGTRRLGKVVGPVGGADRGCAPSGEATACDLVVEISAGLRNLGSGSHVQLQSVAASLALLLAVVGAVSRSTSALLASPESSVLIVSALLPVDVRFKGSLATNGAVRGGLTTDGEAGLMALKKSM